MKILWITPAFLDYRVPVFDELNKLVNGDLYLIYSDTLIPERVSEKIKVALKGNAIGLSNVKTFFIGKKGDNQSDGFANKFIKINYQPDLLKNANLHDVDVIIVEGFFQWSPIGFIKKVFQRKPLVLSYERTFHTERNAPKWRELYRKFISRSFIDAAIVNGSLSKEYTTYLGVNGDHVEIGGMAADSHFFRTKVEDLNSVECRKQWEFNDQLVFVCVGRLIKRKGVMELLTAWKGMQEGCLLVFAGDGELASDIISFSKDNDLNNVRLLGSVDYQNVPSLYLASDVFISATLEDNWSLVVPEAMACGLPIACSKYNGCWPELVHDNVNGKVFDPLDCDDTLNVLEYFYEQKNSLNKMGQASIEIEEKFTPRNAAKAILRACEIAQKNK